MAAEGNKYRHGVFERVKLFSASQHAICARCLQQSADAQNVDLVAEGFALESGGEDIPYVFWSTPCDSADFQVNRVVLREPITVECRIMQVHSMCSFGYCSAVMQFVRWSAWLRSMGRHYGQSPWPTYVDDGRLQDTKVAQGEGQKLIRSMFVVPHVHHACVVFRTTHACTWLMHNYS